MRVLGSNAASCLVFAENLGFLIGSLSSKSDMSFVVLSVVKSVHFSECVHEIQNRDETSTTTIDSNNNNNVETSIDCLLKSIMSASGSN